MRHLKNNQKLGRSKSHREMMVGSMVSSLVKCGSIETTTVKAKIVRTAAEKAVTMARKGTLASRRLIASRLRDEEAAKKLCVEIAPKYKDRPGGYTRVVKTSARKSDGADKAILAWV
ncbi:MAG: 50S ribosomal protein L17 [Kiritimatiellaeota bacterium]|nr:50S ribosomal protein L17 [Kiritimatiellota bacterium]